MRSGFKTNLRKLYAYTFFSNLYFIAGVFVPFLTDWGGLSFTQITFLTAWFLFWLFVLSIPCGAFADFLGRKTALALSSVFGFLSFLVYSLTPNFFVFLLAEFLAALFCALLGTSTAFAYDSLKSMHAEKESKKVLAKFASIALIGLIVSAVAGGFLASQFGLRAVMLLSVIPLVPAFFIALSLKEPSRVKRAKTNYVKLLSEGTKFFLRHKTLKLLAFDFIAIDTIAYFMLWLYAPMLERAGASIILFGVVYAASNAFELLVMNNFNKLESFLGSKKNLLFFSSVITGAMFVLSAFTSFLPFVVLSIIAVIGFGLSRRVLFANYFNKFIPSRKRASILSVPQTIENLLLVVLLPIMGIAAEWSLQNTLLVLGLAAIVFSMISRVEEEHLID